MPKIFYKDKKFGEKSLLIIAKANEILNEYEQLGYDLTLRQLYYQFVARGMIANRQSEYNRLGSIVNDARLAGHIDWNHIVDRTRNLRELPHWNDPAHIVKSISTQFRIEKWKNQPYYVEVWIEKDALVGVIQGVCNGLDVPYFSCRGYTSQSEMWGASQRLLSRLGSGKQVRILHLGDHDPSGIDMTRDIFERLFTFMANDYWRGAKLEDDDPDDDGVWAVDYVREHFEIDRLALNMNQVREYDPPPNPAKITDSRARGYIAEHGAESWELDALPPDVLAALIEDQIAGYLDDDLWEAANEKESEYTATLVKASERWTEVAEFLNGDS